MQQQATLVSGEAEGFSFLTPGTLYLLPFWFAARLLWTRLRSPSVTARKINNHWAKCIWQLAVLDKQSGTSPDQLLGWLSGG